MSLKLLIRSHCTVLDRDPNDPMAYSGPTAADLNISRAVEKDDSFEHDMKEILKEGAGSHASGDVQGDIGAGTACIVGTASGVSTSGSQALRPNTLPAATYQGVMKPSSAVSGMYICCICYTSFFIWFRRINFANL